MHSLLPRLVTVGMLFCCLPSLGCNGSLQAEVEINATLRITTTVDATHVVVTQPIPLELSVTNVFLVEPTATPPPAHASDAGHIRVYLDSVSSTAILVTAQTHISLTLPPSTPPGAHTLHCRVHKHNGTPTNVTFVLSITVQAS